MKRLRKRHALCCHWPKNEPSVFIVLFFCPYNSNFVKLRNYQSCFGVIHPVWILERRTGNGKQTFIYHKKFPVVHGTFATDYRVDSMYRQEQRWSRSSLERMCLKNCKAGSARFRRSVKYRSRLMSRKRPPTQRS